MIEVKFNPKKHTLSVEGHAGYAEKGKDIVCSAVSILLYTLAYSLADIEEYMDGPIEMDIAEGRSHLMCKPRKEYKSHVDLVFWTCLNGFSMLSDKYPENVSFIVV